MFGEFVIYMQEGVEYAMRLWEGFQRERKRKNGEGEWGREEGGMETEDRV